MLPTPYDLYQMVQNDPVEKAAATRYKEMAPNLSDASIKRLAPQIQTEQQAQSFRDSVNPQAAQRNYQQFTQGQIDHSQANGHLAKAKKYQNMVRQTVDNTKPKIGITGANKGFAKVDRMAGGGKFGLGRAALLGVGAMAAGAGAAMLFNKPNDQQGG